MKHSISVIFFFAISLLLSTTSVNAQQAQDADQGASDNAMQDKSMQEKSMQDKNMADGDMKSGEMTGKDMAGKDMANKQSNIRPPVSLIEQFTQDIERSLDSSLVNPMLAGTEDFLTILQPDNHSTDRGIAILLPEMEPSSNRYSRH